ncbi:MAG TPA: GcrA family cell cycle regulator [Thermohalobaculum sp.]|nr:GcrA family cell cycle regulator [Thermohalobaculum sp.]
MSWTDERVDKLRELWGEGMSASQIAKALGGVTRNAVIGKVHRLGLSNRGAAPAAQPASDEPKPAARPAARAAKPEAPAASAAPEQTPEPEKPAVTLPRTAPVLRDPTLPRAPGLPTPEEAAARATLAEIEKFARRITLLELTERTCKWPIGDPTEENFHFCGLPSVTGKPYCEHHVAIAFQPMSARRDRARPSR